jgi:hypothetical protein
MMSIANLTRWSGLASMLGGLFFAIGIPLHPLRHGQAVNTSAYFYFVSSAAAGILRYGWFE